MKKLLAFLLTVTLIISIGFVGTVNVLAASLTKPVITAENDKSGVVIEWKKVSGATKYYLYKKTYANGNWGDWVYTKGTTGLNYTDKTVNSGAYVRYMVCALNDSQKSPYATTPTLRRLLTPNLTAENANTGVLLNWNKVSGAQKYYLYRKTYSAGKWSDWKYIKGTTGINYTDTSVKSGTYVRYMICAIDRSYKSGYTTTPTLRRLDTPKVSADLLSDQCVRLNWNSVSGAQKYYVYRSNYYGGKWSGWEYIKGTTITQFTDEFATAGTYVRYMVCAIDRSYKSAYHVSSSVLTSEPYWIETENEIDEETINLNYGVQKTTTIEKFYWIYSDGSKVLKRSYENQSYNTEGYYATDADLYQESVTTAANNYAIYEEVLRLVNEVRAEANVAPLTLDYTLCQAATMRSVEMNYSNIFSHTRPNGSSCFSVLDTFNIRWNATAENIAAGHNNAQAVVTGWKNSSGHYTNMINPSYTKLGVGMCDVGVGHYEIYWTQLFTN